jgi:hypothetical protein
MQTHHTLNSLDLASTSTHPNAHTTTHKHVRFLAVKSSARDVPDHTHRNTQHKTTQRAAAWMPEVDNSVLHPKPPQRKTDVGVRGRNDLLNILQANDTQSNNTSHVDGYGTSQTRRQLWGTPPSHKHFGESTYVGAKYAEEPAYVHGVSGMDTGMAAAWQHGGADRQRRDAWNDDEMSVDGLTPLQRERMIHKELGRQKSASAGQEHAQYDTRSGIINVQRNASSRHENFQFDMHMRQGVNARGHSVQGTPEGKRIHKGFANLRDMSVGVTGSLMTFMQVCMHVCMYVYVYVCTYVYIHTHT